MIGVARLVAPAGLTGLVSESSIPLFATFIYVGNTVLAALGIKTGVGANASGAGKA